MEAAIHYFFYILFGRSESINPGNSQWARIIQRCKYQMGIIGDQGDDNGAALGIIILGSFCKGFQASE